MRALLVAVMVVALAGCGTMRVDLQGLGHPMGSGMSIEIVTKDGETLVDQDFTVKLNRIYDKAKGFFGKVLRKGGEVVLEPDADD